MSQRPTFPELARAFARIGALSFGGPAAQIGMMHRIVVEENRWLAEDTYLSALGFCMLLPGPEAMQLATYVGWRLQGVRGGLATGLLFVAPGALVMLALAMVYAVFGHVPLVQAVFAGVKAAVLIIVLAALVRIAKRALTLFAQWSIAALSFAGIYLLALPFPLIVIAAGLWGFFRSDLAPTQVASAPRISLAETLRTAALWLTLWLAPLLGVAAMFGPASVPAQLAWFFSKLSVVSFGGAYAGLTYMSQDVAQHFGWLDAGQMLDGLGLAETTPGPLILVTEFVGTLAAYRHAAGPPAAMAMLGAAIALWATFAPCFLWIFVGAPYVEWIVAQPRFKGALSAITAAVVGVILNLAVWFALHVFFARVGVVAWGPVRAAVPELASLDWRAAGLAVMSGVLMVWRGWGLSAVLATAAGVSVGMWAAGI